jgi:hypothetical protein
MKIIIEIEGQEARRAWALISQAMATEEGAQEQPRPSPGRAGVESLFTLDVASADAGPPAPGLFRAFPRHNGADAAEHALAALGPIPRRAWTENWRG